MSNESISRLIDLMCFAALVSIVAAQACTSYAQDPDRIASAISAEITTPAPRPWCGTIDACDAYAAAIARAIGNSARGHDLDPWLLTAMASVESGFNPAARGSSDERGIMQHHPRWFRSLTRRLRQPDCRTRVDRCQAYAIEQGAASLARRVRVCGDLRRAVSGHNSGRCSTTPKARRYARRVFAARARLMGSL